MEGIEMLETKDQEARTPKFTVTIVSARGIRNSDWLPGPGKPDCYCVATRGSTEVYRTKVIQNSLTPLWAEEFDVFEFNDGEELEFKVWDSDLTGADYLGKVVLVKEQFMVDGVNGDFLMEETGVNIRAYLDLKIKMQGRDYPPAPSTELEVTVEKGKGDNYGMRINEQSKVDLQVHQIEQGAVQRYNESVKADMQIRKSDFIVAVNGVTDSCEEMMRQFSKSKVTLRLRRALTYVVILDREDHTQKLGVVVPLPPKNDVIPILDIQEGLIKSYNDKCTAESDKIQFLDRITSVKGEAGSAESLHAKLDAMTGKFQIGMQRAHAGNFEDTLRTGW